MKPRYQTTLISSFLNQYKNTLLILKDFELYSSKLHYCAALSFTGSPLFYVCVHPSSVASLILNLFFFFLFIYLFFFFIMLLRTLSLCLCLYLFTFFYLCVYVFIYLLCVILYLFQFIFLCSSIQTFIFYPTLLNKMIK